MILPPSPLFTHNSSYPWKLTIHMIDLIEWIQKQILEWCLRGSSNSHLLSEFETYNMDSWSKKGITLTVWSLCVNTIITLLPNCRDVQYQRPGINLFLGPQMNGMHSLPEFVCGIKGLGTKVPEKVFWCFFKYLAMLASWQESRNIDLVISYVCFSTRMSLLCTEHILKQSQYSFRNVTLAAWSL